MVRRRAMIGTAFGSDKSGHPVCVVAPVTRRYNPLSESPPPRLPLGSHLMAQRLFSGKRISVERREFTEPDGEVLVREVVVHPGAVAILPVMDDGRIVMTRHFRRAVQTELVEIAAGTLEPDESPQECALRELEEETGYRADSVELLCEFYTTPGFCTERMWVYLATGLTQTQQKLQGGERITVEVMDPDQVRRMVARGEIEDGKTVAALGTYFLRVPNGT